MEYGLSRGEVAYLLRETPERRQSYLRQRAALDAAYSAMVEASDRAERNRRNNDFYGAYGEVFHD